MVVAVTVVFLFLFLWDVELPLGFVVISPLGLELDFNLIVMIGGVEVEDKDFDDNCCWLICYYCWMIYITNEIYTRIVGNKMGGSYQPSGTENKNWIILCGGEN